MAPVQQWEYLTTFVEADAAREVEFLSHLRDWKEGMPDFTPEALMPRLNSFGADGWELVHMQPVAVGRRADVLVQDGSGNRVWSNTYFCVFKRLKA